LPAHSSGGTVSFQLALPETAFGKQASFVVAHPADGTYQAITTPKIEALVAKPKPLPPSPCVLAERRTLVLSRQFKRVKRHANHARHPVRPALKQRVRQAKRKLRAARTEVKAVC
jgi:hypothetical protein